MDDIPAGGIASLISSRTRMSEDVTHFITYERGYYALLRGGRRLDIMHIHAFQPPISDFEDYFSYLFIEAKDGFFVLRQRVLENRPRVWEACLEVVPLERAAFFRTVCGHESLLFGLADEEE